jgi:hypothetical protein
MGSLHAYMAEYQTLLQKGVIQKAYKGLMDYIMQLRTHLQNKHPGYSTSGSLYTGYMDMTYFSVVTEPLKQRSLKIAVVYLHKEGRFEVWLSGYNKQVQLKYWTKIKDSNWDHYHLVPILQGADSILESILVEKPDFDDLDSLTGQIERGIIKFINDIEILLSRIDTEIYR